MFDYFNQYKKNGQDIVKQVDFIKLDKKMIIYTWISNAI
jgi:hypothetical protein